jgi:hypothetical protein
LDLEEVPDRSPNLLDFRGINMDGITLVDSGENDDEIFASDRGTVLLGGNGDDKLHGGAGPDCLVGEKNDDESWGGLGKNVFVVLSKSANGKDTIHDFQGLDADGPVDTIVNLSGNSMSKEGPYTDSSGSYYLLSLNGQNYIKVYGGEPVLGAGGNVDESATNLDDYSQCKGWNP